MLDLLTGVQNQIRQVRISHIGIELVHPSDTVWAEIIGSFRVVQYRPE